MAVIDVERAGFASLKDCWFPDYLEAALKQLTSQQSQQAEDWIHAHVFDAALNEPDQRMNVTEAVRRFIPTHPDWTGSALQPFWENTGKDEKRAARIYGNLVCRIGVHRIETWWCHSERVAEDRRSRTYVLESQFARRIAGTP
jgi:hypothetical protein